MIEVEGGSRAADPKGPMEIPPPPSWLAQMAWKEKETPHQIEPANNWDGEMKRMFSSFIPAKRKTYFTMSLTSSPKQL